MQLLRAFLRSKATITFLLVLLAVVYLKDSLTPQPPYDTFVRTYRDVVSKTKELAGRKASAAEWSAFEQETRGLMKPIIEELVADCEKHPTETPSTFGKPSEDRLTQYVRRPLLQIGRDELPRLVEKGRDGSPLGEEVVENQIRQVQNALDAIRLGPTSEK